MEKEVRKMEIRLDSPSELQDPLDSFNNIKKSFSELKRTKNAMREYIKKKNYESANSEISDLVMLISDTNERIDLMGNAMNHLYGFIRTALMAEFQLTQDLHDAIDELKKDPSKKETLDKIDYLIKGHATLHKKYDKIEPIVNGVDEIVKERKKAMEN